MFDAYVQHGESDFYLSPYNTSGQISLPARLWDAQSSKVLHQCMPAHTTSLTSVRTSAPAANGMADAVTAKLGGSPLTGVDEVKWLNAFLDYRQ